jgi:sodium-dependent phosphate cotransporter
VGCAYLLVTAIGCVHLGFEGIAGDRARQLFRFATHPLLGLVIGAVATALVQSSSTITSLIVGLVAGGLPVSVAVPMVMGANLGTTLTNTVVSLGYVGDRPSFRRAFAAATVHDCFNLLAILIFFPLEIGCHPLERLSAAIAQRWPTVTLPFGESEALHSMMGGGTTAIAQLIRPISHPYDHWGLILVGIALMIGAIAGMSRILSGWAAQRASAVVQGSISRSAPVSFGAGLVLTAIVQSSSTTTSLLVPLAGAGVIRLEDAYPFTLGANIGTCTTALLAAIAVSGADSSAAIEIAMVHLLYNSLAVFVIYLTPGLRQLPLIGARQLAALASDRRYWAVVYLGGVFFGLPMLTLGILSWIH